MHNHKLFVCVCVREQQLDYDSRVVQRRFYQEALFEITLPTLLRKMGSKWKTVGHTLFCSLLYITMSLFMCFVNIAFSVIMYNYLVFPVRSCSRWSSTYSQTTAVLYWFTMSMMMCWETSSVRWQRQVNPLHTYTYTETETEEEACEHK